MWFLGVGDINIQSIAPFLPFWTELIYHILHHSVQIHFSPYSSSHTVNIISPQDLHFLFSLAEMLFHLLSAGLSPSLLVSLYSKVSISLRPSLTNLFILVPVYSSIFILSYPIYLLYFCLLQSQCWTQRLCLFCLLCIACIHNTAWYMILNKFCQMN